MNSFLIIYYTCSIKLYHFKPILMLCLCPFKHRGTRSMQAKARHIQSGEKYEKNILASCQITQPDRCQTGRTNNRQDTSSVRRNSPWSTEGSPGNIVGSSQKANLILYDSPTERIITLRITSERITSEHINTEHITSERITSEHITSERINLNV